MDVVALVVWLLAGFILFLTFFFFLELLFASSPIAGVKASDQVVNRRVAILMPAHNEESIIADSLASIIPQLKEQDEVIVVADNCSDNTKAASLNYPVTVLERSNELERGKGYALDYGMKYIRQYQFDIVLIVDADCIMMPGCRDGLVNACALSGRPIQCLYLMTSNEENPSLSHRLSEFAWLIKNKLRPLGLSRLGGPCQLMGSGMAFPFDMLDEVQMASGCIVEDMKLGLDLSLNDTSPLFLPDAEVISYFPSSDRASEGQKMRWVHGHIEMIINYAPALLKAAIFKRSWQALLLCFDLVIPPLLLFLFLVITSGLFLLALSFSLGLGSYYLVLMSFVFMCCGLILCWQKAGKGLLTLNDLLRGVIGRLKSSSIYFNFFTNRLKIWNKTPRK